MKMKMQRIDTGGVSLTGFRGKSTALNTLLKRNGFKSMTLVSSSENCKQRSK